MKPLFKLMLFAAFCVVTTAASSQISFGLKAGLNLANILTDDTEADLKILPTFHAGAVVEFGITKNIAVQTGAFLQGKGYKTEGTILGIDYKSTANPLYLQVPAFIMYKGSSFFAGVGPYFAFGIAGKDKSEAAGQSDENDIKFGNTEEDDLSSTDFGIGAQAGVTLGPIRVGAGYDLGLSNVIPSDARSSVDYSYKNSVISIFAAYMFGE